MVIKRFVINIILLKKWFLSSYLENAVRSAMNWKDVNNEVMQWKDVVIVYKAEKANLLSKHF